MSACVDYDGLPKLRPGGRFWIEILLGRNHGSGLYYKMVFSVICRICTKNMEAAGGVAPPVGHVSLAKPVAYAALNSMGGPSMLGRPF